MRVHILARPAEVLATGLTVLGLLAAVSPVAAEAASPADGATYLRASVKTGGGQPAEMADYYGWEFNDASVSDDGRFTVFKSNADDLVPGDTNNADDIFLRDSVSDVTSRVTVFSSGEQATGPWELSSNPSMSADGRYVVFESRAKNLVPDDTNDFADVFLRDTVAGTTTRLSLTEDGQQSPVGGTAPAISPDGRFVVFQSYWTLVADDTDRVADVYLRDIATGRTVRVSETYDGKPGRIPSTSSAYSDLAVTSGGRHVTFATRATNLVPGDTNGRTDVFVRDMSAGTTVRASTTDSGAQIDDLSYSPSMSADGRYVAFVSQADSVEPGTGAKTRAYVRDLENKTTRLVSVWDGESDESQSAASPQISADGRHVAFEVDSYDGQVSRSDIFLRDLDTQTTRLVTVSPTGGAISGLSRYPKFSANGHHLAFESDASDLVDGDTNNNADIFVRLNIL